MNTDVIVLFKFRMEKLCAFEQWVSSKKLETHCTHCFERLTCLTRTDPL